MFDDMYPRCGKCVETVSHAILLSEEVKHIWFASVLGDIISVPEDSLFSKFADCLRLGDLDMLARVSELARTIWKISKVILMLLSWMGKVRDLGLFLEMSLVKSWLLLQSLCPLVLRFIYIYIAEAVAFRWAIESVGYLILNPVVFESVCLHLVSAWASRNSNSNNYFVGIIKDYRVLLSIQILLFWFLNPIGLRMSLLRLVILFRMM